ncbi:transglycosylase domain-containing protein [Candidatus Uhrbacteria bacterium]|nr:transglycosylase domain-containing protein [Candidatus Uhrbacteria bacterium]
MSRLPTHTRSSNSWKRRPQRRRKIPPARRHRPRGASGKSFFAEYLRRVFTFFFSRRLLRRLLALSVIGLVLGASFLTIAIAALSRNLPEPGKLIERTIPISTKIYDRKGAVLLYDIYGEIKRTPTALDRIAPIAIQATLVAEDRNFFEHRGFDLKGILRSALLNLFRGGPLRGGSTITQQFIKNAVLTREKTFTRKLKELILAYQLEGRFEKKEILGMYFNEIPYGSTIYGIEAASETFFQKSAKDLDPVEAAILAALPKAPTRLSPFGNHPDELTARVKHILRELVAENYLPKADGERYLKEDPLSRVKPRRESILAPHFVFFVKDILVDEFGEDFIERGGLKVFTTLDFDLQTIAEEEVLKGATQNEKDFKGANAALVALEVKTGQILAMVGSKDYFDETIDGNVNVATRPRQPGSSFKPIVYAAAFEKGFTPETPLWDVVTTFKVDPKDYEPHNYDNQEHGLVTIRNALAGSLNIPAVKTIYLTGLERVLDLADKLGYTTFGQRNRFGLSLVLGGGEVKLLEHVAAFSSLANDGEYLPPSAILKVEDSSGRLLKEWQAPKTNPAMSATTAREITDILSDNNARAAIFGATNYLTLKDRPVAAKTGTTNDFRDAWTVGYTPSLAAGVWVGNNDNTEMNKKADGSRVAAPIWNAFMRGALSARGGEATIEEFLKPEPRPVVNPILRGQGIGLVTLRVNRQNGKLAAESTPPELIEERSFMNVHSELFFLNKDDFSAPPPANPGADPNFETWETAVRRYAEEHNLRAEPPPTEYDTSSGSAVSPSNS